MLGREGIKSLFTWGGGVCIPGPALPGHLFVVLLFFRRKGWLGKW
jgi:hypothetical protein